MGQISADYLSPDDFEEFCEYLEDGLTTRQASRKIGKDRANVRKWFRLHATTEQRLHYARALDYSRQSLFAQGAGGG